MASSCKHVGWKFVGWMDADDGLPPRWFGCRSCGVALPNPSASGGRDVATCAAIDVEQMLAEVLAENACLYEPGAERDRMDEGMVDAALTVLAGRLGDFKPAHCPTASMTESGYDEGQAP